MKFHCPDCDGVVFTFGADVPATIFSPRLRRCNCGRTVIWQECRAEIDKKIQKEYHDRYFNFKGPDFRFHPSFLDSMTKADWATTFAIAALIMGLISLFLRG